MSGPSPEALTSVQRLVAREREQRPTVAISVAVGRRRALEAVKVAADRSVKGEVVAESVNRTPLNYTGARENPVAVLSRRCKRAANVPRAIDRASSLPTRQGIN